MRAGFFRGSLAFSTNAQGGNIVDLTTWWPTTVAALIQIIYAGRWQPSEPLLPPRPYTLQDTLLLQSINLSAMVQPKQPTTFVEQAMDLIDLADFTLFEGEMVDQICHDVLREQFMEVGPRLDLTNDAVAVFLNRPPKLGCSLYSKVRDLIALVVAREWAIAQRHTLHTRRSVDCRFQSSMMLDLAFSHLVKSYGVQMIASRRTTWSPRTREISIDLISNQHFVLYE
jgi:hypothetical protein